LAEVQPNLEEHRKALESSQLRSQEEAAQRLKQILEAYPTKNPVEEAKLKEMLQAKMNSAGDLELVRESLDKTAQEQAAAQGDRKPRMLSHTEARYTDDARAKGFVGNVILGFTVDHDGIPQSIQVKKSLYPSLDQSAIEAVRTWRFEPGMKNGQVVSTSLEVQINFNLYDDPQKKEEQEVRQRREKEEQEKAWQNNGQEVRVRLNNEARRREERETEEKRDAVLASMARISMDHAIQIANSKVPGKVTECSLVGERWQDPGELAKPSLVLYHVVVLSDEATPVKTHVLINAVDGSVVSVKKEYRPEEEEMTGEAILTSGNVTTRHRAIEGGVLNVKATSLPPPSYPVIARAAHASGEVTVRVVIDEGGNVVEAMPVSGHPLLRASAQAAAKEAKFAPTRLNNEPVVVSGTLVYNFVAQ